jgi:MFS family permease
MFSKIFLLFFINVLSAIGYSLLAPLYPSVAKLKGVDEYMIGIIFSVFAVSNIISIPLTRVLIMKMGRRNLFYLAMLIEVGKLK